MKFRALILLAGRTATGIEVPAKILEGLGGGKRPAVVVTINEHSWRTTVGSMGGRSLIPISADVRSRAGVHAGDQVTVEVHPDPAPRTVEVPGDLARTLRRDAVAHAAFEALSYSGKRRHVLAVEGAKTAETRQRRIANVLAQLQAAAR